MQCHIPIAVDNTKNVDNRTTCILAASKPLFSVEWTPGNMCIAQNPQVDYATLWYYPPVAHFGGEALVYPSHGHNGLLRLCGERFLFSIFIRVYAAFHQCYRSAFRFAQQFIDVRENEKKRSQRGVVSVPPKYPKLDDEKLPLNETSANNNASATIVRTENTPPGFKPEHLLELQEKITKEILSTKLGENEMQELQVNPF